MNLRNFYNSLSIQEKKELRRYLNDETIESNLLTVEEWCKKVDASVRLKNVLLNTPFKGRIIDTIQEDEFIQSKRAGTKTLSEFIELRGF